MAENRKGRGPVRYFFTRGQLVLLGAGFTAASAVIFFLGLLMGQKIEERKLLKNPAPAVKLPVEPLASRTKAAPPAEELTFYETLSKGGARASAPVEEAGEKQDGAAKAVSKEAAREQKERKAKPEAVAARQEKPAAGPWSVQVNAFPHERDAQNLAKKLSEKGYDAYVLPVDVKGRTWYRVRVGRFADRDEARRLQETIKSKEKLTKAIVVSR
jgi:cell division septation protein DedD